MSCLPAYGKACGNVDGADCAERRAVGFFVMRCLILQRRASWRGCGSKCAAVEAVYIVHHANCVAVYHSREVLSARCTTRYYKTGAFAGSQSDL